MEGPHGQLGPRFADRLRRYHANGLADVNSNARARDHGRNNVYKRRNEFHRRSVSEHGPGQYFRCFEHQLLLRSSSKVRRLRVLLHLSESGLNSIFRQTHDQALFRAMARPHRPLRQEASWLFRALVSAIDVAVTTRSCATSTKRRVKITRIRCFQRRIGQTFSRTMRGNKVLQYVEAFTEVSGNWRFDNRTVRLGHQTPHAGQLTNLSRGATSTRSRPS